MMSQPDQPKIVILEKNQNRRDYLRAIVSGGEYIPFIFEKENICLDNLLPLQPDLVISGPLSQNKIYRFLNSVKMMNGSLPVLLISSDRSVEDYIAFNGFGNVKVIKVNFEPSDIKNAICKLLQNRYYNSSLSWEGYPTIIGNSQETLKIKKKISELKNLSEPILITGEPGTGKEMVARAIHHYSERRNRPFVKVNLAQIDSDQLNEIIFGAGYDSSQSSKPGSLDAKIIASTGTLILSEVAALPTYLQSRLLTVFENGFCSQGLGDRQQKNSADMAIIVISSKYLDQLVEQDKFRRDLYYRMSVVSLEIPPLRKRVDDIPLLADFFTDKFCREYGVGHIDLPPMIKNHFCLYNWPGNVRELETMVRRVILFGSQGSGVHNLTMQSVKYLDAANNEEAIYSLPGLAKIKDYLKDQNNLNLKKVCNVFLLRTEKTIIKKALKQTNWNRKKAAGLLEISYKSLLNKIKEYKLH
jgi:DNA-binding NtrC family response regulator